MIETVIREVSEAINCDPRLVHLGIRVIGLSDRIILRGEVGSYYTKQLAQEVAMHRLGLLNAGYELQNDINVRRVPN